VAEKQDTKARFGLHRYVRKGLKIAANAIEDKLDCEKTWSNFYDSLNIAKNDRYRRKKYCRLNPKFDETPPAPDAVTRMRELESTTRIYCSKSCEIKDVASTLTASLFYFELKRAKENPPQSGWWTCQGKT